MKEEVASKAPGLAVVGSPAIYFKMVSSPRLSL
jgi:hypothetical protein